MTLAIVRLAAAVLLLLPGIANGVELRLDALSSLGGPATDGALVERVTAGYPVIGLASNENYVELAGFWIVSDPVVTGTPGGEPAAALPANTALRQNVPNPFNPVTSIRFQIARDFDAGERVRLEIFDVNGRRVNALVDGPLAPGTYRVTWDGRDASGRRLASGVYYARLRAGTYDRVIRLVATK